MLAIPMKSPRPLSSTLMLSSRQSPFCSGNSSVGPLLAGVLSGFDSLGVASLPAAAEFAAPLSEAVREELSLPPEATAAIAMATKMRPEKTHHFFLFQGRWALAFAFAAAAPAFGSLGPVAPGSPEGSCSNI